MSSKVLLRHQRIAILDLGLAFIYLALAYFTHLGLGAFSILLFVASHNLYRNRRWSLDFTLGVHGLGVIFSFLFMILSSVFLIFDKGFGVNLIEFPMHQGLFIVILLVHGAIHYQPIRMLRHPDTQEYFGIRLPKRT